MLAAIYVGALNNLILLFKDSVRAIRIKVIKTFTTIEIANGKNI
jgi:hypothetical protein